MRVAALVVRGRRPVALGALGQPPALGLHGPEVDGDRSRRLRPWCSPPPDVCSPAHPSTCEIVAEGDHREQEAARDGVRHGTTGEPARGGGGDDPAGVRGVVPGRAGSREPALGRRRGQRADRQPPAAVDGLPRRARSAGCCSGAACGARPSSPAGSSRRRARTRADLLGGIANHDRMTDQQKLRGLGGAAVGIGIGVLGAAGRVGAEPASMPVGSPRMTDPDLLAPAFWADLDGMHDVLHRRARADGPLWRDEKNDAVGGHPPRRAARRRAARRGVHLAARVPVVRRPERRRHDRQGRSRAHGRSAGSSARSSRRSRCGRWRRGSTTLIDELIDGMVDAVARDGDVEVVDALAAQLPSRLTTDLLGFPEDRWRDVKSWSERLMRIDRRHDRQRRRDGHDDRDPGVRAGRVRRPRRSGAGCPADDLDLELGRRPTSTT